MSQNNINNKPIFAEMTVKQAIDYCHQHRNQFISEAFACGEDGVEQFDCMILCIEGGYIKPEELPKYGMNYTDK